MPKRDSVHSDDKPGASGDGERDDSHCVRSTGHLRKRQRFDINDDPGPSSDGLGEPRPSPPVA